MIAKKRKTIIIVTLIIIVLLSVIGTLITLYFTTDLFKATDKLFVKYMLQNVDMIDGIARKEPSEIKEALETQKLETNLKAKLSYTDKEKKDNSVNHAEIDVSSNIDKQENYDYKDIRMVYENENVARVEYLKDKETYGIRLDGIQQFVSATTNNLDELELKTGISKKNLELLTYIFEPIKLSQFISFTQSETEVLSSTYLGIIEQKTEKSQYKKSKQTLQLNGTSYATTAYSLKLPEEQLNDLIITILERIEKDQILLGKLDTLEQELQKYYLYEAKEDESLRNVVTKLIDDEIQEIKNHNIGQEETEITVYVNKGKIISTLLKTPDKSISLDINEETIQIDYIENLDNSVLRDSFTIQRAVQANSQNIIIQYSKTKNDTEQQGFKLNILQNKNEQKLENTYQISYNIEENVATMDITQYIDIVEQFEDKVELEENNNTNLENYEQADVQKIMDFLKNNSNEKIKNILEHVTLEDINSMLKRLNILKENEITFNEEPNEEIVTEAERVRFNSNLTFFIGKEVNKATVQQLIETAKDCIADAQVTYEMQKNSEKKRIRGMIIDIKRNTSNNEKIQEINTALAQENENTQFTVAMAFDENTRLINQITIVANEFLNQ